jgi:hypothetical protein
MKRRNDLRNESEASNIEASSIEDRSLVRDIALVVAGISIGSGIALLLAPSSGDEFRHAIGRRYRRTMKFIGRSTEDLRDRVEDLLEYADDLRSSKLLGFLRRREDQRRYRDRAA